MNKISIFKKGVNNEIFKTVGLQISTASVGGLRVTN